MFATGVTVVTTHDDEQVHGMTANAFMSVSLRPRSSRSRSIAGPDARAPARRTPLRDQRPGRRAAHPLRSVRGAGRGGRRRGRVRPRARDAARARSARAHRGARRALVLGRRPLAVPGAGRVRAVRRRSSVAVPRGGTSTSWRARRCSRPAARDPRRDHGGGGEAHLRTRRARRSGGRTRRRALRDPRGRCSDRAGGNVLATFGPGEFFGEIAVLDGRPRSADVVAATPFGA